MTVRVELTCDECQVARYVLNAGCPKRVRAQAARGGWTCTDDGRDLCPVCTRHFGTTGGQS